MNEEILLLVYIMQLITKVTVVFKYMYNKSMMVFFCKRQFIYTNVYINIWMCAEYKTKFCTRELKENFYTHRIWV